MDVQKAVIVEKIGQPVVLRERPIPTPQEGEILVQVTVVGLNPYDHRRDTLSDQSGLQEYCILDAYTVAKIPENRSLEDGDSLGCNIVAPFWAIFGSKGLGLLFPFTGTTPEIDYSNETIVIIGAGGNCGKYAVQVCAVAGFGRIVVTASKQKNEKELLTYGATHVVDRNFSDKQVEEKVREIVGDELIYVMDAVNTDHTLGLFILSSKRLGTLSCLVPSMTNTGKIGEKKAGYEEKFINGQSHNNPKLARSFQEHLPTWMEKGKVKTTGWDIISGLDPSAINAALDIYKEGKVPPKQFHIHVR
ncbi:hypothetical protein GQ44DRAFT_824209 [Phaeosphaeriaceae sp. PMI808]|nr:hypothetical protein GQ44DRAFT_824209 [Phaeosphaeriaceae sp. PMI808]